jgi:hypothetical protein
VLLLLLLLQRLQSTADLQYSQLVQLRQLNRDLEFTNRTLTDQNEAVMRDANAGMQQLIAQQSDDLEQAERYIAHQGDQIEKLKGQLAAETGEGDRPWEVKAALQQQVAELQQNADAAVRQQLADCEDANAAYAERCQ